jgi:hypothetical protein
MPRRNIHASIFISLLTFGLSAVAQTALSAQVADLKTSDGITPVRFLRSLS